MAVMLCGNEINIQAVFRIDDEFMTVRGRLAGTTDLGSVMFLPYSQIDYIGFRMELKEPEVQAMFAGNFTPAPKADGEAAEPAPAMPAAPMAPAPAAGPSPAPMPAPMPVPAAPAAAGTAPGGPVLPGKAALLERLRRSRAAVPGAPDPNKPG